MKTIEQHKAAIGRVMVETTAALREPAPLSVTQAAQQITQAGILTALAGVLEELTQIRELLSSALQSPKQPFGSMET